jgi:hypothetical protein
MAAVCTLVIASPAMAATHIRLSALVLRPRDLPGFSKARHFLVSTTSALEYAEEDNDKASDAEAEASELSREGFQRDVTEVFPGARREAVSDIAIYSSTRGAEQVFLHTLAEDEKSFGQAGLKRYTEPAVPGSVVLGDFQPGHRGATSNVFFATGRCVLTIANVIHDASTRAQADLAPFAGAKALYTRAKRLCS